MNLEPVKDYVLLQREEALEQTAAGIFIPTHSQEKPLRGVVIAVGNQLSDNTVVKMGRTFLYKKHGGTEVVVDGCDYVIIKEHDLLLGL